jgi:hypothetical protein
MAHIDTVDNDCYAVSADRLSRKRQHALEHRNAEWQVPIEIEECGEKIGWLNGNKFSHGQLCHGQKPIKADRNAI